MEKGGGCMCVAGDSCPDADVVSCSVYRFDGLGGCESACLCCRKMENSTWRDTICFACVEVELVARDM